jgi:pullulanase/glycogen debranching enzyme
LLEFLRTCHPKNIVSKIPPKAFNVHHDRREVDMPANEELFPLDNDPLWYKDAIIYELHVRAFHDSNGDGIGDFRGLTQKLDHTVHGMK